MKVLVACEMSGQVTGALLRRGVDAWSCDILPTIGSYPGRHIQADVIDVLAREKWGAVIAFPPCTHLSNAGQAYRAEKSKDGRLAGAWKFFNALWHYSCEAVAIENPLGIVSSQKQLDRWLNGARAIRPSQIVCWTDFGDTKKKRTCLWLRGLPLLLPTTCRNEAAKPCEKWFIGSCPGRSRQRSMISPYFAEAMAAQWSEILRG